MTLRGVELVPRKISFCAVADNNRVAGQLNINPAGKLEDVLAEYIRLRFASPTEKSGYGRFSARAAAPRGNVERRPNLA